MPGNMPTPGYRAISKSSRFSSTGGGVAPVTVTFAPGIVSLDNRSYVMDNIEYAGNACYPIAGSPVFIETRFGVYLNIGVAGPDFLYDVFDSVISDYTAAQFSPQVGTNVPLASSADLLTSSKLINPKDFDFITGYNQVFALMNQPQLWAALLNIRLVASYHIPVFTIAAGTVQPVQPCQFAKVSQKVLLPPGYKYLITFPSIGMYGGQSLLDTFYYNAAFRCTLELPT